MSPSPFGATTGIKVRRGGSENSPIRSSVQPFSDAHKAFACFLTFEFLITDDEE